MRNNHLHINQSVGSCRAGSLPNVNHIGADKSANDLQSALLDLDDIKHGREPRDRRNLSPARNNHVNHQVPHRGRQPHHSEQHKQRADASPYSTPYLSPPDLTNWRRTNSDSALHQTALLAEQQDYMLMNDSPTHRRLGALPNNSNNQMGHSMPVSVQSQANTASWDPGKRQQQNHQDDYIQYSDRGGETIFLSASLPDSGDSRPKSCEVPGITIYPTQEEPGHSHHHIPLSSNTGSLPDLTNLHFPAPLATPIDAEDQNSAGSASTQVTNSHSSLQYSHGPGSPYTGAGPPPSPYSPYTSNCGSPSPYSPQSPNSVNSAFSPPPSSVSRQMAGGVMYETNTVDNSMNAVIMNGSVATGKEAAIMR